MWYFKEKRCLLMLFTKSYSALQREIVPKVLAILMELYLQKTLAQSKLKLKLTCHNILHYCIDIFSLSIKRLFSFDCVNSYFSQSIVNYLVSIFFQ